MKKKEDLRIRKTKANLYKGLLLLMEQKSFEEIKVIDICNVSLINRSTFYDHFSDKYELLSSLMEDTKEELIINLKKAKDLKITSVKDYYLLVVKELVNFINKNINSYAILSILKVNNNSIANDMIFEASKTAILEKLEQNCINHSSVPLEDIVNFYVSGLITFVTENILGINRIDEDKIIRDLEELLPNFEYLEIKNNMLT